MRQAATAVPMIPRILRVVREYVDVSIAIAIGAWFAFSFAEAGIQFAPDSTYYMTYAVSFHSGEGLRVDPIWPPLYPILLGLTMGVVTGPGLAASVVSAASLAAASVFLLLVLRRVEVPLLGRVCLLGTFLLSSPLFAVYAIALAGGPLLAFLLAAIYFGIRHFETERLSWYSACALSVAAAALTRYAGYVLIATLAAYTLFFLRVNKPPSRTKQLRYAAAFSLAVVPSLLYVIRNVVFYDTLHGPKGGKIPLWANVALSHDLIGREAPVLFWVGLLGTLLALIGLAARRRFAPSDRSVFVLAWVLGAALLSYGFAVIGTSSVIRGPYRLEPRYLAPFYVLLIVLVGASSGILADLFFRRRGVLPNLVCLLVLGLVAIGDSDELRSFLKATRNTDHREMHVQAGFNTSRTARDLRAYFDHELAEHGKIAVTAAADSRVRWRANVSRALFFRRSMYDHRSDCSFRAEGRGWDYVLRCSYPAEIAIDYKNVRGLRDHESERPLDTLIELLLEIHGRPSEPFYFVHFSPRLLSPKLRAQIRGRTLPLDGVLKSLTGHFQISRRAVIQPYVVVRLEPRASSDGSRPE